MSLFKRKKSKTKAAAESVATVRRPKYGESTRPDFIYYSSGSRRQTTQSPDHERRQPLGYDSDASKTSSKKTSLGKKIFIAIFVVAAAFLLGQFLLLGTSSKVILVKPDGTRSEAGMAAYEATVDNLLKKDVFQRTKLTIDTAGIARQLRQKHPEIERAVVAVPVVGRQPQVVISQSETAFVIRQAAAAFELSAEGFVTSTAETTGKYPLIIDETGGKIAISEQILARSHVSAMQTVWHQLKAGGFAAESIVLPAKQAYEFRVKLKDQPFYLRFNFEEDAMVQGGAAVATLKQLEAKPPAEYIDLRVPGRVYYK